MNFLLNYTILVSFMTLTMAKTIGAVPILPEPPVPVGPPTGPESISVNLASDFLMTTLGFTGEATANQQYSEGVIGNSEVPATLSSSSSNSAHVEQSGVIDEVALVDVSDEAVDTLNAVNTDFLASGSEEINAALHGITATVEYAGESAVPLGGGVTLSNANTEVDVVSADVKRKAH